MSQNPDAAWFERRERVRRVLVSFGPVTAADVAERLGWDLREVSAKLQDLRRAGMADRNERGHRGGRLWWAT